MSEIANSVSNNKRVALSIFTLVTYSETETPNSCLKYRLNDIVDKFATLAKSSKRMSDLKFIKIYFCNFLIV